MLLGVGLAAGYLIDPSIVTRPLPAAHKITDHHEARARLPGRSIETTPEPIKTPSGETIHELIGRGVEGTTDRHSLAHVVMIAKGESLEHYHPAGEETYYILKGSAKVVIDGTEFIAEPGQAIYTAPGRSHKIMSWGEEEVEYLAITVPAWKAEDMVFLEEWKGGKAVRLVKTGVN